MVPKFFREMTVLSTKFWRKILIFRVAYLPKNTKQSQNLKRKSWDHINTCVGTIKYVGDIAGHMGSCLNFWSIFLYKIEPRKWISQYLLAAGTWFVILKTWIIFISGPEMTPEPPDDERTTQNGARFHYRRIFSRPNDPESAWKSRWECQWPQTW
jgi:hypothetical protein